MLEFVIRDLENKDDKKYHQIPYKHTCQKKAEI